MMVVRIIIFFITTSIAKHHHSNLKPNEDFFGSVYIAIHSAMDNLFESMDISKNFTNKANTKLLLTMQYHLSKIADTTFETFNDIKKIVKDNVSNQSYFMYSFNQSEEDVLKLDTMVNEILNKKKYDAYSVLKGTTNKRMEDNYKSKDKHKIKVKDKSMKIHSNSAFNDSREFKEFIINFLAKINNHILQDFKKASNHVRNAVPSTRNLKEWAAPPKFKYDFNSTYTRRIFRRSKARVNQFPFIVSIHIMGEFTCSGCLISRDLVITSASCLHIAYKNDFFERNLKSIYVRLGSDHTTRNGETIPVQNVFFHPEYEPKHLLNNLAIIGLEERVRFSRKQNRIRRILWDKSPGVLPNETKSVLLVGWGASATKPGQVTQKKTKLRVVMLDVYNTDECRKKYAEDFINKENFCATVDGESGDVCNGDMGGPGIVGKILMGVVSFGAVECGAPGAPTVFTKLGYYVPWIESIMSAHNKRNQTNHNSINTRRKSKYLKRFIVKKLATNDQLRDRDEDYPDDLKALRDVLMELVKTDQSVVDDVIYGDFYDEFSKFFKIKEQIELKESSISRENEKENQLTLTFTTERMIEIKVNQEVTISTKTPIYSTPVKTLSLRKPPIDSEYEIGSDVVQYDYTDNYEKSSEEVHELSIEVPSMKKSLENKGDMVTWSKNSDRVSDLRISNELNDYSVETNELNVRPGDDNSEKRVFDKMHTTSTGYITSASSDDDNMDDTPFILQKVKRKERTRAVVMKHEQLSKHASSVLDQGKLLATKTFIIDFNTTDVHVANDKLHKNGRPKRTKISSSKKSEDRMNSQIINIHV